MSDLVMQTAEMLSLLPDDEVSLINELVKKLILAWDPDFTKVTQQEAEAIDKADNEMKSGIYFSEDEVWD